MVILKPYEFQSFLQVVVGLGMQISHFCFDMSLENV